VGGVGSGGWGWMYLLVLWTVLGRVAGAAIYRMLARRIGCCSCVGREGGWVGLGGGGAVGSAGARCWGSHHPHAGSQFTAAAGVLVGDGRVASCLLCCFGQCR
jgi:hypothetical protein